MNNNVIVIGESFSKTPAGRYYDDGPFSGQKFREEVLIPALSKGAVVVDLSGVVGYGSSFLEEVFGGLIRKGIYNKATLKERLHVQAKDTRKQCYVDRVCVYMNDAWAARGE